MIKVFAINQKIGIIDRGRSSSRKKNIKNVTIKQLIVIALKEVVITLIPIYCNTERYNPNLIRSGVVTIGTEINNHKFDSNSS